MNVLEFRRRLMMSMPRKWYPIFQGNVTLDDMIAEYGDLMQTFENAPDVYGTGTIGGVKKGAMALVRNLTSVQFGSNYNFTIIVYEDGVETARWYNGRTATHTFNSTTSAKHIVFYSAYNTGNQSFTAARWLILPHVENFNYDWLNMRSEIKYLHIENGYNVSFAGFGGWTVYFPNFYGYNGAVYYIPDWWRGALPFIRYVKASKLRLSKGTGLINSIYAFGNSISDNPNLTDIYVHWGLGEVPNQPGNRFTGQWKLHIPDLGNAEDNAALVAEYRSKGWNYVSGRGIFNDVEATEPQEQLD